MAKKHSVHVVPFNGGWAVKQEGHEAPTSTHSNRPEAITAAQELALDEETALVIHRKDGQFDEVQRPDELQEKLATGATRAGRPAATAERADLRQGAVAQESLGNVHARDLFSTGSRVSWSAILAGLVLTLAIYAALSVLGVAIGLSVENEVQPGKLAIGGGIWALVSLLIALFVGGFVTSRTTVGENHGEAMTYGLILWGALFVLLLHLTSVGLNIGFGQMLRVASGSADPYGAQAGFSPGMAELAGDNQPTIVDRPEPSGAVDAAAAQEMRRKEARDRATTAAWWTFAAILLSMLAAVAGSIVGAGPQMVLRGIRERGFLTVRPEPATARA